MKKSILNLEGAQELTRKEQKNISGGAPGDKCVGNDVSTCGVPPPGYYYLCLGRCFLDNV